MTKETLTIHKALAEKKLLEGRISLAIQEGVFCIANKHSNEKINGIPLADFEKTIQGSYDKVTDLIKRQEAIEKAITLSNAVTKVSICGEEYTVAEAIWMRNKGIKSEKLFMDSLKAHYNTAQRIIKDKNGVDLERRAEDYVTALYGAKEGKNSTAEAEKTRKEFLENNSYELVDTIKILDKIEALEKRISEFMAEVDSALSCSNALTEITIEY